MTGARPPAGAQLERTMLSWRRSALSYFVVGLLVARVALEDAAPPAVVVSAAAAVAAMLVAAMSLRGGRWSSGSTTGSSAGPLLRDGRLPALVSGVAIALCLVVAVLAL